MTMAEQETFIDVQEYLKYPEKSLMDSCADSDSDDDYDADDDDDDDVKQHNPCQGRSFAFGMKSFCSGVEQAVGGVVKSFSSSQCGPQPPDTQDVQTDQEYLHSRKALPTKISEFREKSLMGPFRGSWDAGSINLKQAESLLSIDSIDSWEEYKDSDNFNPLLEKAKDDLKEPVENILHSVSENPVLLGEAREVGDGLLLRTRSCPESKTEALKVMNSVRPRSFDSVDFGKVCSAMRRLASRSSSRDSEENTTISHLPKVLSSITEEECDDSEDTRRGPTSPLCMENNHIRSPHSVTVPSSPLLYSLTKMRPRRRRDDPEPENDRSGAVLAPHNATALDLQHDGIVRKVSRQLRMHLMGQDGAYEAPQRQNSFKTASGRRVSNDAAPKRAIATKKPDIFRNHDKPDATAFSLTTSPDGVDAPRIALKENFVGVTAVESPYSSTKTTNTAVRRQLRRQQDKLCLVNNRTPSCTQEKSGKVTNRNFKTNARKTKPVDIRDKTPLRMKIFIEIMGQRNAYAEMENAEDADGNCNSESVKVINKRRKKKLRLQTPNMFGKKKMLRRKEDDKNDRDTVPLMKAESWMCAELEYTATEESSEAPSFELLSSHSSMSLSFGESTQKMSMFNVISAIHTELTARKEPTRAQHEPKVRLIPLEEC